MMRGSRDRLRPSGLIVAGHKLWRAIYHTIVSLMDVKRASGILLHPTSLPGPYGAGDLGTSALVFLDMLARAGQSWWQMLPLTPPGSGGSPYSSTSAFAGNPALIDLTALVATGALTQEALDEVAQAAGAREDQADLDAVASARMVALKRAHMRWRAQPAGNAQHRASEAFCEAHTSWLEDYSLYAALKEAHGGAPWYEWPEPLRQRDPAALARARQELTDTCAAHAFIQWLFHSQWEALREQAHARGIKLIGDIPIFVAMDSADVWARRDLFLFDDSGQASVVAGVPPDYFSATGQKWGNPLYDWEACAREGYAWWIARVKHAISLVDVVRIDHFRGFEAYWEVPADAPDATQGRWVKGPGDALFEAIRAALGEVPFIAEDLGLITDEVLQLRERHALPGMKVMHFAFDGQPDHPFLPHTYPERCVAYAGTHDNDTTRGWYEGLDGGQRHQVRAYLGCDDAGVVKATREALLESAATLVILTPQDLFELGSEARMNTPATMRGNWSWRMTQAQLEDATVWQALGAQVRDHAREGGGA